MICSLQEKLKTDFYDYQQKMDFKQFYKVFKSHFTLESRKNGQCIDLKRQDLRHQSQHEVHEIKSCLTANHCSHTSSNVEIFSTSIWLVTKNVHGWRHMKWMFLWIATLSKCKENFSGKQNPKVLQGKMAVFLMREQS